MTHLPVVLVLAPTEIGPETRLYMQVVYLGDTRKAGMEKWTK